MNGKTLRGNCTKCGGPFEYPAEMIGTQIECPHCARQTELLLETPKIESGIPKRLIIGSVVVLIILIGGLLGSLVALKQARSWAEKRRSGTVAPSSSQTGSTRDVLFESNGLRVTQLKIQRPSQAAAGYAIGSVENRSATQRKGVVIRLAMLDQAGSIMAETQDSTELVEPAGVWEFRAPLPVANAVNARITALFSND